SPWDLTTALEDKADTVDPGDTIYVRGGTYSTLGLSPTLQGEAGNLIVIKPYPGEWAVIDGNRTGQAVRNVPVVNLQNCSYLRFQGFRVTNSATDDRVISAGGSNPTTRRGGSISVQGAGIEVINCILDNCGEGLAAWTNATGFKAYGNIILDNGWLSTTDGTHGHGIYTQSTDEKWFTRNVVLKQFVYTLHAYAESGVLDYFRFHENVFCDDWVSVGGPVQVNDCRFTSNICLRAPVSFGGAGGLVGLQFTNNHATLSFGLSKTTAAVVATGNRLYRRRHIYAGRKSRIELALATGVTVPDLGFDANYYWLPEDGDGYLASHEGVRFYTPAQWVSEGQQDANSTFNARQPGADDDTHVLWVNEYDDTRATLTIMNWSQADSVSVDLSAFAAAGDYIRIRNVQDYFGDVRIIQYTGNPVAIDMRAASHSVSTPIGYTGPLATTSFPTYGVFVLEILSAAAGGWRGIIRKALGWLVGEAHPPGAEWYYRHLQG
ncbi:MAG: hypothetical protein LC130_12450, partial [Bryobacterales bacterium]|nr:hypothetical protein [Bryobacterales bacterium]